MYQLHVKEATQNKSFSRFFLLLALVCCVSCQGNGKGKAKGNGKGRKHPKHDVIDRCIRILERCGRRMTGGCERKLRDEGCDDEVGLWSFVDVYELVRFGRDDCLKGSR